MKAAAAVLLLAALSQGRPGGGNRFQVSADVACYRGDDSLGFLELCYGFPEAGLTYAPDSTGALSGAAGLEVRFWSDTGLVFRRDLKVPHSVSDPASLPAGQLLVGIETFGFPAGSYRMEVKGFDAADPSRCDSMSMQCRVVPVPAGRMALSDIELATSIRNSPERSSMFYKNTLEVVPNPGRLYGDGLPILNYYLEAYNLASDPRRGNLLLTAAVVDADGKEVIRREKRKPRTNNSSAEIGTVNLSAVRGGTYTLKIALEDSQRNEFARVSKKFFVYKAAPAGVGPDSAGAPASGAGVYAFMGAAELDADMQHAAYVMSDREKDQYRSLAGVDAKRLFLEEFWRRRDPFPETPRNELRDEYFGRLAQANADFAAGSKGGGKTDRGRVLIIYGKPDDVERHPSEVENYPYEIWQYSSLSGGTDGRIRTPEGDVFKAGVVFVFVDTFGFNDYQLVHSNHRNELHNENWYREYAQKAISR